MLEMRGMKNPVKCARIVERRRKPLVAAVTAG